MCQGLLEESDGEGEPGKGQDEGPEVGGDQATGAEASPTAVRPASVEKKTEQQRRREKAARMLVSTLGSSLLCPVPQPGFSCLQPGFFGLFGILEAPLSAET